MMRTFLAVDLTPPVRAHLARIQTELTRRLARDPNVHGRIAWVQQDTIHLTVKFLGDTDERLVGSLRSAMEPAVRPHYPIHIPLGRLGAFPHPGQPRVLWIGPPHGWERHDHAERLRALHRAVEDVCGSFGFAPDDRPFSPHLTLARVKDGARQIGQALTDSGAMAQPVPDLSFVVKSVMLMQSEVRPAGPRYTRLWEI